MILPRSSLAIPVLLLATCTLACYRIEHDMDEPAHAPSSEVTSDSPPSTESDEGPEVRRDRARQPKRAGVDRDPNTQGGGTPSDGSKSGSNGNEPKLATDFTSVHNLHRRDVSPAANPPLPALRWSAELAAHAEAVAAGCSFDHSETSYGENIFAATSAGVSAEEIVGDWAAEAAHWNHDANRCAPDQICGHYTQVVWRESTELGCAVRSCTTGSPFGAGSWTFAVCNYNPPGNYSGRRPY